MSSRSCSTESSRSCTNYTHELIVDGVAHEVVHVHPGLPQLHGTELTNKVFHTTHHTERGQAAHDGPASVPTLLVRLSSNKCVVRNSIVTGTPDALRLDRVRKPVLSPNDSTV